MKERTYLIRLAVNWLPKGDDSQLHIIEYVLYMN
jgi:hypothetical protein